MKTFITKNRITGIYSIAFLLFLWKAVSLFVASELIVPAPEKTFRVMLGFFTSETFVPAIYFTILRGTAGFLISLVLGIITGTLAGLNRTFAAVIKPVLVTIRSTPVISIILVALIWFTTDLVPVFIGFLIMYPIISTNVTEGIRSMDPGLVEMAKTYRVRPLRILSEVYIPAITPFITGGISNAVGIGWKAIIASEVLSQPRFAIGTQMHNAQSYLLVTELIAWTVVAVTVSYIFETFIRFFEKRTIVWR